MKKIFSITLIAMILVIFSNIAFAETQKYNITLKKAEIIDRSEKPYSIGDNWDNHIKVGENEKELIINQKIQESSLNYYISLTEDDELPDVAEKEGVLSVGSNNIIIPIYEYRKFGTGEPQIYKNRYAKWEFIIDVEQVISPTQTNTETSSPSKVNTKEIDSTNSVGNSNNTNDKLPKTGENNNITIILIGICFISVGMGILIKKNLKSY